jgi:3-deoxy-D-manno-octulosonate 8-phosphate phosphatase (KDO 8-P phosphatase)
VKPSASRLAAVRLLVMDVDGVLTDGGIYYTERGDELKRFDVRDGQGLVLLRQAGVLTAVITRRRSEIVERRADELGIAEIHQGATDKRAVLESLLARRGVPASEAVYVGDDVGDLPAMHLVGFPVAVADAVPPVKRAAAYITRTRPGHGAIRELCDLILAAKQTKGAEQNALPAEGSELKRGVKAPAVKTAVKTAMEKAAVKKVAVKRGAKRRG